MVVHLELKLKGAAQASGEASGQASGGQAPAPAQAPGGAPGPAAAPAPAAEAPPLSASSKWAAIGAASARCLSARGQVRAPDAKKRLKLLADTVPGGDAPATTQQTQYPGLRTSNYTVRGSTKGLSKYRVRRTTRANAGS